jgi:hypothetical protein
MLLFTPLSVLSHMLASPIGRFITSADVIAR